MIETQPNTPTQEDKTLAAITHASGILTGFIMPLVIWLVSKDTKPWVTAQAKEALNFQITVAIAMLISIILTLVLIGAFLMLAVWIFDVIFCIIAAVKASQGEAYKYPVSIRIIQ